MSIFALMYCQIPIFSVKVYPLIHVFKNCFQCNIYVSMINAVIPVCIPLSDDRQRIVQKVQPACANGH